MNDEDRGRIMRYDMEKNEGMGLPTGVGWGVCVRVVLVIGLIALAWVRVGRAEVEIPEEVLQTIAMESANQDDYGQYLVASVIINRTKGFKVPLVDVVKRPKQFSCWNDPKWSKAWLGAHYTPIVRLRASNAFLEAFKRPHKGITHYHTVNIMPYWAKGHTPAVVHGSHAFYEGIR